MLKRRDLARALGALSSLARAATGKAMPGASGLPRPFPLGAVGVVGTRHHPAARLVAALAPGDALDLRREPGNRFDPLAIAVHLPGGDRLGYLPRAEARRLGAMMDAGGRLRSSLAEQACEVSPGNWRFDLRLELLTDPAPPPPSAAAQLDALLRAPPLLAERRTGPGPGASAVMLAGACAGWQRTDRAEWLPPGALPLPAWHGIAEHWHLLEGEMAAVEAARIAVAARRFGLPVPGQGMEPPPPPPEVPPYPPERPRLLYEGWLRVPDRAALTPAALRYPSLRRGGKSRTVEVLGSQGRIAAPLPPGIGEVASRLLEEGCQLDIVARGEARRAADALLLPYALRLRGDDPPDVARTRVELLRRLNDILPLDWDTQVRFGDHAPGVLERFLRRASPFAHRAGGRLPEVEAAEILAWAIADADLPTPRSPRPLRGNLLAPKRRGRGLPLSARLRLVAERLDGGLRETPQRFLPVAARMASTEPGRQRSYLRFLVVETLADAAADPACSPQVLGFLIRVRQVLTGDAPAAAAQGQALAAEVEAVAPHRRRRRSIHCHGVVTEDRRLLLVQEALRGSATEAVGMWTLYLATAYAVADYDRDHFVMRGRHIALRVRALSDWLECNAPAIEPGWPGASG